MKKLEKVMQAVMADILNELNEKSIIMQFKIKEWRFKMQLGLTSLVNLLKKKIERSKLVALNDLRIH